jgi:hypothetical protein
MSLKAFEPMCGTVSFSFQLGEHTCIALQDNGVVRVVELQKEEGYHG